MHQPTPKSIWIGRSSEDLQYWHQAVRCLEELKLPIESKGRKVAMLGYAGDEGVSRNQGRRGAANGPIAIRKMMAPMAFHLPNEPQIFDLGDIVTLDNNMEESHDLITETVSELLADKVFPVLLGGGHDLAFAHGRGILNHVKTKGEKLGIINLDAHFDLRALVNGQGHSGSPFFQLAKAYPSDFHYLCLGVQSAANPSSLFNTAKQLKVNWMEMEDFTLSNWENIVLVLNDFCNSVNKIYLSIDLDGFSSAYAPGVSAPSPMGFSPELAFKVFEWIAGSGKLISVDVVELNPEYDQDNTTARLAARCVEFVLRKLL
ncbi:formimidoylglutamase [Aquiflexum lacus]|uniref:formimidoylglutamase n=1 Tax=Aquiflexum lacus TaxID=2483805 RepID=UPI00189598B6|nr:formimidoylglutamase [Aquiflexum lacus]